MSLLVAVTRILHIVVSRLCAAGSRCAVNHCIDVVLCHIYNVLSYSSIQDEKSIYIASIQAYTCIEAMQDDLEENVTS